MGMFAEAAGWLRLDDERLEKAPEIIKSDIDVVGHYSASWCPQTKGDGYSRHLFFSSVARSENQKSNLSAPKSGELPRRHSAKTATSSIFLRGYSGLTMNPRVCR
jgi:hypothetical protein